MYFGGDIVVFYCLSLFFTLLNVSLVFIFLHHIHLSFCSMLYEFMDIF